MPPLGLVHSLWFIVNGKDKSKKATIYHKLPTTNQLGFTLIELMIVISIIAILSTIGVIIYSGVQQRARDTKRQADLESISTTLELSRIKSNLDTYPALDVSQFANGIPKDPGGRSYCVSAVTTGDPAIDPSAVWTTNDCAGVTDYALVGAGSPPASTSSFRVCAALESGSVSCIASQQ